MASAIVRAAGAGTRTALVLAPMVAGIGACRGGDGQRTASVACRAERGDTAARLFLEKGTAAADSLASVRLCVARGRDALGSYHAAIGYDTSAVTLVAAAAAANGAEAVNPNAAGLVQVAGADPRGFGDGPLATLTFRVRRKDETGPLELTLAELTTTAGADARSDARVSGLPADDARLGVVGAIDAPRADAGAATRRDAPPPPVPAPKPSLTWIAPTPRIDSLVPASASVAGDAAVNVTVYGDGFTAKGNVVSFGPAEVGPLASPDGKSLRFVVPASLPSRGEVPPMQLGAGEYSVRVRNANGVSNTKLFTKRE